jgi:hypothetical protein
MTIHTATAGPMYDSGAGSGLIQLIPAILIPDQREHHRQRERAAGERDSGRYGRRDRRPGGHVGDALEQDLAQTDGVAPEPGLGHHRSLGQEDFAQIMSPSDGPVTISPDAPVPLQATALIAELGAGLTAALSM